MRRGILPVTQRVSIQFSFQDGIGFILKLAMRIGLSVTIPSKCYCCVPRIPLGCIIAMDDFWSNSNEHTGQS